MRTMQEIQKEFFEVTNNALDDLLYKIAIREAITTGSAHIKDEELVNIHKDTRRCICCGGPADVDH